MPKSKEKTPTKKKDEEELSQLMQESLKKSKERVEEETFEPGLEEESTDDIDDLALQNIESHQFVQSGINTGSEAPVLERMALSAPGPRFVGTMQGAAAGQTETNGGNGDDFKYMPSTNQPGEATYTGSTHVETEIDRVDFSRVGREERSWGNDWRVSEHLAARENQGFSGSGVERTERLRSFDASQAGREREEVKYEKYNPKKLPSGR